MNKIKIGEPYANSGLFSLLLDEKSIVLLGKILHFSSCVNSWSPGGAKLRQAKMPQDMEKGTDHEQPMSKAYTESKHRAYP